MPPDTSNLSEAKRALLEKMLRGNLSQAKKESSAIPRRRQDEAIPLSFMQQGFWVSSQLNPDMAVHNEGLNISLPGPLDVAILEQSIQEMVRRHEAWRTSFPVMDGKPVQRIHPDFTLPLPVVDLHHLPLAEREGEALRLGQELIEQLYDLTKAPPIRVLLVRLGEEDHRLFLAVHHSIYDGFSGNQVVLPELYAMYQAFLNGQPSLLPELPIQYADYAVWQSETLQGQVLQNLLAYWKERLAGAPNELPIATDHPHSATYSTQKDMIPFHLSADLSRAIETLSHQEGATLFMALLAAFSALLYRYSGQEDIVIGTPSSGRTRPEVQGLIGAFINTLPIRLDLSGNASFRQVLKRAREAMLGGLAHEDLPFEEMVINLQPERVVGQNPYFQILFAQQPQVIALPSGWSVRQMASRNRPSRFDLMLDLEEGEDGLHGTFGYKTELFEPDTIQRMIGHWQHLLEGLVAHPDQPIASLSLLTEPEQRQLLVDWNATRTPYPQDRCIPALFEEQAAHVPNALAVVCEDAQLTYQQLNERANQLAHYLRARGVGPDTLVGLFVERSLDMLVGLLGILKAGGAYVPLDPRYPKDRVAFMLEDAQAPLLLTQQHLAEQLPPLSTQVICLDTDWQDLARERTTNPIGEVKAENLAYMIYTSGSTGKPKGVLIEHRQLLNYLSGIVPRLGLSAGAHFALVSTIAADLGNTVLFPALCTGGCLHIIAQDQAANPLAMAAYCRRWPIDCLKIVPSHLAALLTGPHPEDVLPRQRLVIGGEAYSWELLEQIHALNPACRILNHFGPTETTVGVLTYEIDLQEARHLKPKTVIGRPLPNSQAYVLDRQMQPVPVGVPGELYIGGAGVARGYLHRPELTAERFIRDPFSAQPGARLYKTGDRVCYLPTGEIEFLGRFDFQVKIRGFRLELGEIETALRQHPSVRETVVTAREYPGGDKRLVAYVVPAGGEAPTSATLRAFLKEQIPDYMVPSAFVILEALPLTLNGKVDRQALPAPEESSAQPEADFVAPRSPTEEHLAAIWATLLGLKRVGVTENFFELGGHSLLAVRVLLRVQEQFQVEIPLATLFEAPTIAELALRIVQYQADTIDDETLAQLLAELEAIPDTEIQGMLATNKQVENGGR